MAGEGVYYLWRKQTWNKSPRLTDCNAAGWPLELEVPRFKMSALMAPIAAEEMALFLELRWLSTIAGTRMLTTWDRLSFNEWMIFWRDSRACRFTLLLDSCSLALKASKTWGEEDAQNKTKSHFLKGYPFKEELWPKHMKLCCQTEKRKSCLHQPGIYYWWPCWGCAGSRPWAGRFPWSSLWSPLNPADLRSAWCTRSCLLYSESEICSCNGY